MLYIEKAHSDNMRLRRALPLVPFNSYLVTHTCDKEMRIERVRAQLADTLRTAHRICSVSGREFIIAEKEDFGITMESPKRSPSIKPFSLVRGESKRAVEEKK